MKINEIIILAAAFVTVAGGIVAASKAGRRWLKRTWQYLVCRNLKLPKETIRAIPQENSAWWASGLVQGKPAMQVVSDWILTNISDREILISRIKAKKYKTTAYIHIRHPKQNVYGTYDIPSGFTTDARIDFWIQPPNRKEGEDLKIQYEIIDNLGNVHKTEKIRHISIPKKKVENTKLKLESICNISNSVEKEVVALLQAEIDRYAGCGRRVGGLGSITTTYQGRTLNGVGSDTRKADSPDLQSLIPDPENARICSDNGDSLINYYAILDYHKKREFVNALVSRISKDTPYSDIGYFILYVLFRTGNIIKVFSPAKEKLQGDPRYGFSDMLRLLDGFLKYEPHCFSIEMLDQIEMFIKGITEHTFGIGERIRAIRALLLKKRLIEEK